MFCKNCGKEIDDNAAVCVYCGVPTHKAEKPKSVNGLGIAGFVIGLLSLGLGVYFCIASIIGVVLSGAGMAVAKTHRVNGLAIAGLVLSIISLVIWGITWIAVGSLI